MYPALASQGLIHNYPLNFAVVKCRPSPRQGATPNATVTSYNEDVAFSCPAHQSFDPFNYKDNYRIVKCLGNNTIEAFTGKCQGEIVFYAWLSLCVCSLY